MARSVFLFLIGFFALGSQVRAESVTSAEPTFAQLLDQQASFLESLPISPAQTPTCHDRYERMWREGVLKIDWFYGYMNVGAYTQDTSLRNGMIEQLVKPCPSARLNACGFTLIEKPDDGGHPTILEKNLDGGRLVRVRMWHASVSDTNDQNIIGKGLFGITNATQNHRISEIWKAYESSLSNANAVIYSGHSRHGTGLGFRPQTAPDVAFAATLRPGNTKLFNAILRSSTPPQVMMFAGCSSKRYYVDKIARLSPRIALAGTVNEEAFGAGEQVAFGLVDSLLAGRCEDEMNEAIHSQWSTDHADMRIYGFDR